MYKAWSIFIPTHTLNFKSLNKQLGRIRACVQTYPAVPKIINRQFRPIQPSPVSPQAIQRLNYQFHKQAGGQLVCTFADEQVPLGREYIGDYHIHPFSFVDSSKKEFVSNTHLLLIRKCGSIDWIQFSNPCYYWRFIKDLSGKTSRLLAAELHIAQVKGAL